MLKPSDQRWAALSTSELINPPKVTQWVEFSSHLGVMLHFKLVQHLRQHRLEPTAPSNVCVASLRRLHPRVLIGLKKL